MKFLIVDDDIVQASLLKELVDVFECDHVSNGDEAFIQFKRAQHKKSPYDLIFMDLMMPGFDGYMVIDTIRSYENQQELQPCKIIVISGKSLFEGLTPRLRLQCDDYLTKPLDPTKLLHSLENLGLI